MTISVYEYDADAENYKGDACESDELIANSRYVLEVGDIYTKSGEEAGIHARQLRRHHRGVVQERGRRRDLEPAALTEYTNIDGRTIAVTPETRDHKYMVKVTTANSFYNELRPSLVDFEYSEDNIDTVLQEVTVAVEAEAGTPVNGVAEWVYQLNPITLTATVTPVSECEPSGHVEFYYGWALNGFRRGRLQRLHRRRRRGAGRQRVAAGGLRRRRAHQRGRAGEGELRDG